MNALPRVLSLALSLKVPSRLVPRPLQVLSGCLVATGLLLPAIRLHAQTDATISFPEIVGTPVDPAVSNAEPSPDKKRVPTFTIQSLFFRLPGEHTTGATRILMYSKNGYSGTVSLTCKLISGPKTSTPAECAMYPNSVTIASGGGATPQIVIFGVGTKLPPGLTMGKNEGGSLKWLGAGSTVLACGLLFGIPARRRGWRSMVSAVLLLVAIGSLSACVTTPKIITAGNYVFDVTGTDSKGEITVTTKEYISVL